MLNDYGLSKFVLLGLNYVAVTSDIEKSSRQKLTEVLVFFAFDEVKIL